jgi:hypothetical protein
MMVLYWPTITGPALPCRRWKRVTHSTESGLQVSARGVQIHRGWKRASLAICGNSATSRSCTSGVQHATRIRVGHIGVPRIFNTSSRVAGFLAGVVGGVAVACTDSAMLGNPPNAVDAAA